MMQTQVETPRGVSEDSPPPTDETGEDMRVNDEPRTPDRAHCGVVEPGNGGRYEYMVWRVRGQWFAAFPDYGRACRIGAHSDHRADYVGEKFRASRPDAEVMAVIINACISGDVPAPWADHSNLEPSFAATHHPDGPPSMADFLERVRRG